MSETVEDKKPKVDRPEKPDEAAFNEGLKKLQKEHSEMMEKLNAVKSKLDIAKPGGGANGAQTPQQIKQNELRAELNSIKNEQSTKKSSRQQLHDRQKLLNDQLQNKITAQRTARAKVPYKSTDEVDQAIARLEKDVDSGTLKLVDERKALADITALRKQKKLFTGFDESQAAIDKDKAALDDLKKQMNDPEQKALSDRYTEIQTELNSIKAEQDSVYQNLSSLRDERTKLQNAQQEKFQEMKAFKDDYYGKKSAFREYEQEAWRIKQDRRKAEQDAYHKEKKRKIAERILEEASEKAYHNEIITCEGLINYFDPENANKKTAAPVRELAAQPGRTVSEEPKGMKLAKKDEKEDDYFIGGASKKKGKKGRSQATAAGTESPGTPGTTAKFSLSLGILEELGKVDVHPPMAQEDVPATLEKLREKLTYYKDNQDRVTKENIAKAQAEVDKLDQQDAEIHDKSSKVSTKPSKKVAQSDDKVDEVANGVEDLKVDDEVKAE